MPRGINVSSGDSSGGGENNIFPEYKQFVNCTTEIGTSINGIKMQTNYENRQILILLEASVVRGKYKVILQSVGLGLTP